MKPQVWAQLKNKTVDEIISALERDGWIWHKSSGSARSSGSSRRVYIRALKVVSIHYHPQKTYDPKLLDYLFEQIGWTEQDLKRLKLIK